MVIGGVTDWITLIINNNEQKYRGIMVQKVFENIIYLKSILYYIYYRVIVPFSDRVGLPLHNIPSPFPSVMDIFFVDLKFGHIRFYTTHYMSLQI